MLFSDLFFLLFFLVLCYGIYFLTRRKRKSGNTVLLVFSLIFYAWGGPLYLFLLAGVCFVSWAGALIINSFYDDCDKKYRKATLFITVGTVLASLAIFKYLSFALGVFGSIFRLSDPIIEIALPLGISFYTFQLISYVVDVYRYDVPPQKNYFTLLLYASLFHQCIAGPIVRYSDVLNEINRREDSFENVSEGITRFAIGLAKKTLLANRCAELVEQLAPLDAEKLNGTTGLGLLLASVFFTLEIYLDFSAYSDMAIGLGQTVGFHYRENFNYPYTANSITDFWRRWHISLSSFFRDYVYIPLGGSRCGIPKQIVNLAVVWILTGIWHGAGWNFIIWGAYYLILLILEKFVFKFGKDRKPPAWYRIPVLLAICFGWVLFRYEDLSLLGSTVSALFTEKFADSELWYTLLNNIFFLPLCIVACTPVVPFIRGKIQNSGAKVKTVFNVIGTVIPAVLLILSILSLVGDSFNPFLYFNF